MSAEVPATRTPRWLPRAALACSVLGLLAIVPFFLVPPTGWLVEALFAAVVWLLVSGMVMGAVALILARRRSEPTGLARAAILVAASPALLVTGVWLMVAVFAGGNAP